MRLLLILLVLFVTACSSTPKPAPRTVWINGYPIPENCMYADEQWTNLLGALNNPNAVAHLVHTSDGTYSTARVGNQTYVCNRSELELKANKR